ncbi:hypothetical protein [Saccharomonospora piscinae]|uniref:hypothetical protein n=1 Tax=Saccharomonospora piscinae TaxID=687388 RepID=UPI0018CC5E99|nr:hypothetical protein [Saccharomonospora piscinae]
MTRTGNGASTLHIVVTCTNRKRVHIPEHLRLGNLRESRSDLRFAAWTRRLSAAEPAVPAFDLYGGEHWRIATSLPSTVEGPARLWVCSAGYGLVSADTALHPYAATFSAGTDSVGRTEGELRQWWGRLTNWSGPQENQPRSFAELAKHDANASIVAIMSDTYLRACADDLHAAAESLADPHRMAVIGPPRPGTVLDELIVPVMARLRPVVGGSLHALYVRAGAYLLTKAGTTSVTRTWLREAAREATDAAPDDPGRRAPGERMSDEAVREFIRHALAAERSSATTLLRRLRDMGRSCEQSRFKRLYDETMEVLA